MTSSSRAAALRHAAMIMLLAGCGGGSSTGPGTVSVASVAVSLASSTVIAGGTVQATATVKDAQGNTLTGRSVTWNSSATGVATVSTTGLLTAVSAGTTTVTATSEGIGGQATLTVTAAGPQIGGLTIKDANGQTLLLSNIAGTIGLDFDVTLPTGTGGTVIAAIDNVDVGQVTVPASSAPVEPGSASLLRPAHLDVNTAIVVYSVSSEQIQAAPSVLNGAHILSLRVVPTGASQPAATTQANITVQNPDGFTGRFTRGAPLTTINGVTWSSGDLSLELVPLRFSGSAPQSAIIKLADDQASFGSGALNGIVAVGTKGPSDIAALLAMPKAAYSFESKLAFGKSFYLSDYAFGSTHYTAQTAEPNLNGNCLFTRGTGFIQPVSVPTPTTLPAGCNRWVRPSTIPANLLSSVQLDLSTKFFHDTKGPSASGVGAITLAPRPTTAGQSAFGSFGGTGVINSYVGVNYNFAWGVDKTKITDGGAGLDVNQSFELHIGSTLGFTPGPGTLVTDYNVIPETGATRSRYFTTGWQDALGNAGYIPITTNTLNPYTTGNVVSTNLGVDPALVGINRIGGTLSYTGPWDGYVWRNSSVAGLNWNFSLSGSPVGYSANSSVWSRWYKGLDVTKGIFGEGANTTIPWNLAGAGGTTGTGTLSYATLMANSVTKFGGTGEGFYTGFFGAADQSGATPLNGTIGPVRFVWDFTAPSTPTVTGPGPFTSGSNATIQLGFLDNIGLDRFEIGPIFNFANGSFEGGKAYIMPGQVNIGPGFGGTLTPNSSLPLTDLVPNGLIFYNNPGGAVPGPVFNTIGVGARAWDLAGNYSPMGSLSFANSGSFTVPVSPTSVRSSFGPIGLSYCRGDGCTNGAVRTMTMSAEWESPTNVNPFNKFEWYALSAGRTILLATAPAAISTPIVGGFKWSTSATYDWINSCQPAGPTILLGVGQSLNRLFWYKNNPLINATLTDPPVLPVNCWNANLR